MKIRYKISFGFLITFIFVVICGGVSIYNVNSIKNEINQIKAASIPQFEHASEVIYDIQKIINLLQSLFMMDSKPKNEIFEAKRVDLYKTFASLDNFAIKWRKTIEKGFELTGRNDIEEKTFDSLVNLIKTFKGNAEDFFSLYRERDKKTSKEVFEKSIIPSFKDVQKLIWKIEFREYKKINEKMQSIRSTAISNFQVMFIVIIISLFISFPLSYFLSRNIT